MLRDDIWTIISKETINEGEMSDLLDPILDYFEDPTFKANIKQVVTILTMDRDGNNKFDIEDIKLLREDIIAVTMLVNTILLVIVTTQNMKPKYNAGATEELILKMLVYILLVIIPEQTGEPYTLEEKEIMLDLIMSIYELIKVSGIARSAMDAINRIKVAGLPCCGKKEKKELARNEQLNYKIEELRTVKKRHTLEREVRSLRQELAHDEQSSTDDSSSSYDQDSSSTEEFELSSSVSDEEFVITVAKPVKKENTVPPTRSAPPKKKPVPQTTAQKRAIRQAALRKKMAKKRK